MEHPKWAHESLSLRTHTFLSQCAPSASFVHLYHIMLHNCWLRTDVMCILFCFSAYFCILECSRKLPHNTLLSRAGIRCNTVWHQRHASQDRLFSCSTTVYTAECTSWIACQLLSPVSRPQAQHCIIQCVPCPTEQQFHNRHICMQNLWVYDDHHRIGV